MIRLLLAVALAAFMGCSGAPKVGESCVIDADCRSGASCVAVGGEGLRLCLAACDPMETVICREDEEGSPGVCLELEDGGACFTGGHVKVGEACDASADCVIGALCVDEGDLPLCRVACDTREPSCLGGQSCVSLGRGHRGYCAAVPSQTRVF